jgi:hypothetical protein
VSRHLRRRGGGGGGCRGVRDGSVHQQTWLNFSSSSSTQISIILLNKSQCTKYSFFSIGFEYQHRLRISASASQPWFRSAVLASLEVIAKTQAKVCLCLFGTYCMTKQLHSTIPRQLFQMCTVQLTFYLKTAAVMPRDI